MPKWNGGIIGVVNIPSGSTSGVWGLEEQYRYALANAWDIATFTTGTEQTVSQSGSTAIQLADGQIATGIAININSISISMHYRTLTVNNATAVYGAQQTVSYSNCSGGSYNVLNPASPGICSGFYISQNGLYSGYGDGRYKNLSVTGKTLTFSGTTTLSAAGSGVFSDVPGTSVTNATSVNIMTGFQYYVDSGNCGRMQTSLTSAIYRTVTIS